MNGVQFHDSGIKCIRALLPEVRMQIGKAIRDLQRGLKLQMPVSRPMPSIAIGVSEIRARDEAGIYRSLYYLKDRRSILVFHVFTKKTQKTAQRDINLARQRLKEMLYEKEN